MISTIASTGDSKVTKNPQITIEHNGVKQRQQGKKHDEEASETQPAKQVAERMAASANSMTPILRYVPKSRRREGELSLIHISEPTRPY